MRIEYTVEKRENTACPLVTVTLFLPECLYDAYHLSCRLNCLICTYPLGGYINTSCHVMLREKVNDQDVVCSRAANIPIEFVKVQEQSTNDLIAFRTSFHVPITRDVDMNKCIEDIIQDIKKKVQNLINRLMTIKQGAFVVEFDNEIKASVAARVFTLKSREGGEQ